MKKLITLMLMASCTAFYAYAADDSSDPCSLLVWQDFQTVGAVQDTPWSNYGWYEEKPPKEIPGSKLFSSLCSAKIMSRVGRTFVIVSIDTFEGKISEQQVSEWLKSVAAADTDQQDAAIVKVGDTTCESSQYGLPASQDYDSALDVIEYYIACDQQVGTQHISLNVHVPKSKKDELPNPEQAKALLDKSIIRMKLHALGPPDKISL